jgi:Tfp pilus assembly protein PilF
MYCCEAENPFYHITPNTLPISWFEGVAHYRLGENDVAEKCFLRALKMTPYEVRVLNDYGAVLFKLGKPQEAIKTLKETLVIDPFFDDARFNLGAIYYLTGQRDSAREQIMSCRESQKKRDFLEEMQ